MSFTDSLQDIVRTTPDHLLVALVMKLTGGSANPHVIRAQIKNWRDEIRAPTAPIPE